MLAHEVEQLHGRPGFLPGVGGGTGGGVPALLVGYDAIRVMPQSPAEPTPRFMRM